MSTRLAVLLLSGTLLSCTLLSCTEEKPPGEDSTPVATTPISGDLVTNDENNYGYTGLLDAPGVATAEYVDVAISWDTVVNDLQCHDFDITTEADNFSLLVFPYATEEEVEAGIAADTLFQSDLELYVNLELDGTRSTAQLSELTFLGTDPEIVQYYAEGSGTWLLLLSTGTVLGLGGRDMMFLRPTAGETNTTASFEQGCGILDFTANLQSLTPLPVPVDGPWTLDWSGVTINGQGAAINLNNIDRVMVGHYPDVTPADLEASFFDLELITDELWYQDVSGGSSVSLDALTNENGLFPGFSTDGTWILALRCTLCRNPAPLFLTVLSPQ